MPDEMQPVEVGAVRRRRSDALPPVAARQSFPDEVTQVLTQRIADGTYPPGTKLPSTREMALAFGVSPPIIREAVSRLKYDGLVEPRQGSGVWVRAGIAPSSFRLQPHATNDIKALSDTFELRLYIEQVCAELAATRRSPHDLAVLQAELDAMANAVRRGTDGTVHDVRFHIAVARATGNSALLKLVEFLQGSLAESIRVARDNSARVPGQSQRAQREHEHVLRAIVDGDGAAARRAVRTHLLNAASRLGLSSIAASTPNRRRKRGTSRPARPAPGREGA